MSTMTKIQSSKFVAVCEKLGLNVVKQPSQWKVTGTDPNRRFYIPGTKTVHKVELSGWSHDLAVEWSAVYPGKKAPSSKITHVVNFAQDEKLVLRDFFKMAKSLVAKAKRAPVAPSSPEPTKAEIMNDSPAMGESQALLLASGQ
jgi:hypothetical protein